MKMEQTFCQNTTNRPSMSLLGCVCTLTVSYSNTNSCQLQQHPRSRMTRFKTSGWPHLEAMHTLFPNDLAHGSHAYHPAAAAAHSISTNVSAGPSGTSDFSSTSHISPDSMSRTFPSGTLLHASPSGASSHTSPGSASGVTSGTPAPQATSQGFRLSTDYELTFPQA